MGIPPLPLHLANTRLFIEYNFYIIHSVWKIKHYKGDNIETIILKEEGFRSSNHILRRYYEEKKDLFHQHYFSKYTDHSNPLPLVLI